MADVIKTVSDFLTQESFHVLLKEHTEEVAVSQASLEAKGEQRSERAKKRLANAQGQPAAATARNPASPVSVPIALQTPSQYLNSQLIGGDGDHSLIAIIGLALTLQAKENSQFWSSMWQQATMSMNTAVGFAPQIYHNIVAKYTGQSDQLKAQADSSFYQGMVQVAAGATLIVLGGMEGYKVANEPSEPSAKLVDETAEGTGAAAENEANGLEGAAEDVENDMVNEENQLSTTERLGRKLSGLKSVGGKKIGSILKVLDRVSRKSQMISIFTEIPNKFIDNNYKGVESSALMASGQADANAQQMEQYAQYFNQNFNRSEDLRGGSQNNIDTAMQILKSISDTMTQTTQAMFRG